VEQVRDRINQWFESHEVAWEIFMVVLAVVFVVLAFLPRRDVLTFTEAVISIVFVSEFTVRIVAARSRRHYLLHHWMDLVALLPALPGYHNATVARMARLLRLLMILRLLGAMDRMTNHIRGVTAQPGLTYLIAMITVMVLAIAGIDYFVERGQYEGLNSYSKAVYWALVTVTTTGYGDIAPQTPLGRAMATLLMIGGLILWSLLTASIINYTSELSRARHRPQNNAVEELKGKLDRLDSMSRDELVALRGAVLALVDQRLTAAAVPPSELAQGGSPSAKP